MSTFHFTFKLICFSWFREKNLYFWCYLLHLGISHSSIICKLKVPRTNNRSISFFSFLESFKNFFIAFEVRSLWLFGTVFLKELAVLSQFKLSKKVGHIPIQVFQLPKKDRFYFLTSFMCWLVLIFRVSLINFGYPSVDEMKSIESFYNHFSPLVL